MLAMTQGSRRPQGAYRRITPEWRARVRRELEILGKDQNWLASQIKATPGAISGLLNDDTGPKSSRLVDPVSELLRIPPPEFVDEREERLVEAMRELRNLDASAYDDLESRALRVLDRVKNPR